MNKYLVFRLPCFMEDEGREDFYGSFNSKEAAEERIAETCSDGYYKATDFVIRMVKE